MLPLNRAFGFRRSRVLSPWICGESKRVHFGSSSFEYDSKDLPNSFTTRVLPAAAKALAERDAQLAQIIDSMAPRPCGPGNPLPYSAANRSRATSILSYQRALVFERLKSNIEPFTASGFIEAGEASLACARREGKKRITASR